MQTSSYRFSRAGGFTTNPQQWAARTGTAIAQATAKGPAQLSLIRDTARTTGVLSLTDASNEASAQTLAQAYGSRAERLSADEAEVFHERLGEAASIGELVLESTQIFVSTMAGADPVELSRLVSTQLPEDSWLQVSMRQPTRKESKNWKRWFMHHRDSNSSTDQSLQQGVVVIQVRAGAPTRAEVDQILTQVKGSMPGFSMDTGVRFIPRVSSLFKLLFLGLILGAASVLGMATVSAVTASRIGLGVATVALLVGVAALFGFLPSPLARLRTTLANGAIPPIPVRSGVRAPKAAKTKRVRRNVRGQMMTDTVDVPARDGDYPFVKNAFVAHPAVFAAIASPHGSVTSGEDSSAERAIPPALIEARGPVIGFKSVEDHTAIHLGADDSRLGVFVNGRPGSGKSELIQSLWGFNALERVCPSGIPGNPGRRNTLIALEEKGEGAAGYRLYSQTLGDDVEVMNVADPLDTAIDLFAVPGTITQRAAFITSALTYVYGEESFGVRSREAVNALLPAALVLNRADVLERSSQVGSVFDVITADLSPLAYLHLLLEGRGADAFDALVEVLHSIQLDDDSPLQADAKLAVAEMSPVAEKRGQARTNYLEAPRNKLAPLAGQLDSWFTPKRSKTTWDEVITEHRAIVINTGSAPGAPQLDGDSVHLISSLLMFTMWEAVKRNCVGWSEQNRWVSFFTDELALLAGYGGSVLTEYKDQGRAYGFRPHEATQRPEQLPERVRRNRMAYDTLISYGHNDTHTSEEVASAMGNGFTADDVRSLPRYHAVMVTTVDGRRQSPVVVAVPNFKAMLEQFESIQRG